MAPKNTRASDWRDSRFNAHSLAATSAHSYQIAGGANVDGPRDGGPSVALRWKPVVRQPDTGTIVISTRRFWARPASVSLLAIGRVSPAPMVIMRSRITPRPAR